MLQIINISKARNNLSKLVEKIVETKKPVIIVKDSLPSVVVYPYEQILKAEEQKEKEWSARFDKMMREGRKIGKAWLKKKGIGPKTLTEEKMYVLIKDCVSEIYKNPIR